MFIFLIIAVIVVFVLIKKSTKDVEKAKKNEPITQGPTMTKESIQKIFSDTINEILEMDDNGVKPIKTAYNIENENIFYEHTYNWEFPYSGGRMKIPYCGVILITDKKIRFIGDTSSAFNVKKIIGIEVEDTSLTITPENGRVLVITPMKQNDVYKSAELGKFYAILQFVNGKKLKDFAPKMCEIMHLNSLIINGKDYLNSTN